MLLETDLTVDPKGLWKVHEVVMANSVEPAVLNIIEQVVEEEVNVAVAAAVAAAVEAAVDISKQRC